MKNNPSDFNAKLPEMKAHRNNHTGSVELWPLYKNKDDKNDQQWRGIFILDCATKEEAEKLVQSDPAIAAGIFSVDIVPWYTSPMGSFKKGKPEKAKP